MLNKRTWHTRHARLVILAAAMLAWSGGHAAEAVMMYTYHTHAPFMTSTNGGLSFDLAKYLGNRSNGRFSFGVDPVSRPKLNTLIEKPATAIVPWVNPAWFKDKEETKYLWSKRSLMEDGNALISHRDNPIIYEGPQSLRGTILGGVRGHVYTGIDSYIKETGLIRRIDTDNHRENFLKLAKRRIDATITPEAGARYLIKKEGMEDTLYISPKPHSRYSRRIMILRPHTELQEFLEDAIEAMPNDPEWQSILSKYR